MLEEQKIEAPEKEKKIVLTEAQFAGLLDRIKKLEGTNSNPTLSKRDRVKTHTAYMREYKGELVISYKPLIYKKNEDKEIEIFMPLVLESGKEVKVNYQEFLEDNNKVNVNILKRRTEEEVQSQGTVQVENPDPLHKKNYSSFETELEVVIVKYELDVEVMSGESIGKKLTIAEKALNM